jgi:hypothetical protein
MMEIIAIIATPDSFPRMTQMRTFPRAVLLRPLRAGSEGYISA